MYIFLRFVINVYFQIVVSIFMLSFKLTYSKAEFLLVYRSMNFDIYNHHHNQTTKRTVPSSPKMPFILPLESHPPIPNSWRSTNLFSSLLGLFQNVT